MRSALLCLVIAAIAQAAHAGQDYKTWKDYGGGPDSSHFVDLKQINKSNVNQLEVAWVYPTGDKRSYVFNPIVVDNVMYVHGAEQLARRARRGHGQGDLDPREPSGPGHARHCVLGKQGPQGSAADLRDQQPPAGDRRADGQIDSDVRQQRAGRSAGRTRPRSQDDRPHSARVSRTRLREPDSAGLVDRRSLSVGARRYSRL